MHLIQVAIFGSRLNELTYQAPDEMLCNLPIGALLSVPLGKRKVMGLYLGRSGTSSSQDQTKFKIKNIIEVIYLESLINERDLEWYKWIANYYQSTLSDVLDVAISKTVLERIKAGKTTRSNKNNHSKKISDLGNSRTALVLTGEQSQALAAITKNLGIAKFKGFLLHGVTGSGKTEVYLRAARAALESSLPTEQSILILVPEIALTPQLRSRFEAHFGDHVAVLHSGLTPAQRASYWMDIRKGTRRIVVGARSAIFAPAEKIGLIVIDEEHDPSYKQNDRLRYHARDIALKRASLHGATVVLGSATPSLETYFGCENAKFEKLVLSERPHGIQYPDVQMVDLSKSNDGKVFSEPLIEALRDCITAKNQAILFVNRKGYSNYVICTACKKIPQCLNCSVSLTYHAKPSRVMRCHYCAYEEALTSVCQQCGEPGLKYFGVGTQQVEEEFKRYFPDVSVTRFDNDVAPTQKKIESILQDFRDETVQVLIGTQMIAKGHDFPKVALVGIISADQSLSVPDFRAAERTFQLVSQVAGRAGRSGIAGKVIVQTYMPTHYALETASQNNYLKFYEHELEQRRDFAYPPFTRIALLEFRGRTREICIRDADAAKKLIYQLILENSLAVNCFGPSPSSIEKILNEFRWHILLKAEKFSVLNALMNTLRRHGVRFVDVDPINPL